MFKLKEFPDLTPSAIMLTFKINLESCKLQLILLPLLDRNFQDCLL